MKLLITGATGFIGRALVAEAKRRGHAVAILTRDPARVKGAPGDVPAHGWDPMSGPPPAVALDGVNTVIHLAGENVGAGRWTKKRMAAIRDSRVVGTHNLVAAFSAGRPRALVCGSAIGYYGDRGDEILTEDAPPGDDFLAQVCREWEAVAARARERGVRWASVRTGIVLGKDGGALEKMLPPFRMNVGGPIGTGRQWMSWIHLNDIVGIFLHAAEREDIQGPVNGTAPLPQPNYEFTKTLGRVLRKWTFMPMPAFMLRIVVGKFARTLTSSQRCDPAVAKRTNYGFRWPTLEGALRQVLG